MASCVLCTTHIRTGSVSLPFSFQCTTPGATTTKCPGTLAGLLPAGRRPADAAEHVQGRFGLAAMVTPVFIPAESTKGSPWIPVFCLLTAPEVE